MKKFKGLINRMVAMSLSGMLVIGSASGSVFAASTDPDPGQTSEVAEEMPAEDISSEGPMNAAAEEPAQYYTVTLDANGGYFENEWDDVLGDYVEQAEVINKLIPVGGTVPATVPVLEQENTVVTFLGWSLERDGDIVGEEYAPVGDCTLYALWEIEELEEIDDSETALPETDGEEPVQGETAEENQEENPIESAAEGETAQEDFSQEQVMEGETEQENSLEPVVKEEIEQKEDSLNEYSDINYGESDNNESVSEDSKKSAATSIDTTYYTLKADGTLLIHSDCNAAHKALFTGVNGNDLYEGVKLNSSISYIGSDGHTWWISEWVEYLNPHVEEIVIEDDKEDGDDDWYDLSLLVTRFPNVKKITVNSERSIDLRGGSGQTIYDADDIVEYQAFKKWWLNGISTWNSMFRNKLYLNEGTYYDGSLLMGASVDYSKDLTIRSFNYGYYDITIKERIEELGASFEEITCELDKLKSVVADDSVFYDGKSHKTDIEKEMHIICENGHGEESALWHKILTKDKHFTVEYLNKSTNKKNDVTNAGSVQVTVRGINGHTGTLTGYFIIKPQALSSSNVSLSSTSYTYNGSAKMPSVTVKNKAGNILKADTDYTVSYKNNTNAGTATVTVTGKGNYTGNASATFKINKAAQSITVKTSVSSIAVGKTATVSTTGSKGKVTYKSSNTSIATVDASTGIVTGKKAGTVTITATSAATSNYNAASKTVSITVTANKTLKKPGNCNFAKWNNAKYTSCRIAWNKVDGAEGYETLLSWTNGSNASRTIVKSNVLYRDCTVHPQHVSQMMVRAFYISGGKRVFGPWSNVEYITPSPTKLTTKNASLGTDLKMNISWNIIYGCNGYNVFLTTNPNGTWYWNQSTSTKADATSAVITKYRGSKLKKNTRYYVRIVTRRQRNGVFCTVPMPASNTYIGSFIIK